MVVIAGAENVRRRWRVRMAWICAALAVAAAVIEVTLWLPGRIMTPVRQVPRAVAELFDAPVLKALLELPMEQRSRYRFFARAEDVPPNVADVVPLLSAHGYRSSRTRAFHDYFDFNARSPRADALAIRWWVSDRELPDMRLLKEVAGRFIYERQSAPPVLWQRGGDGRPYDPGIAGITWHANEVDVRFACPVKGQVIFAQVSFPGFQAVADGEPVAVKSADGLMAVDLINPTVALSIRYRPGWLLPSTLLAGGALLITVVALTSTAVSRVSRSPAADTW